MGGTRGFYHECIIFLQSTLKDQELRNERLSVKLQQRPEADDVRAMQQQMSSLHILMEQTSSEHERELGKVQADLRAVEGERDRLREDLEAARRSVEELPGTEDMSK